MIHLLIGQPESMRTLCHSGARENDTYSHVMARGSDDSADVCPECWREWVAEDGERENER